MDVLKISKVTFGCEDYMKPLKVSTRTHARVKDLADRTNRPISEIANMLVDFALERVEITEED